MTGAGRGYLDARSEETRTLPVGAVYAGALAQNFDLATIVPNEQKVGDLFRHDIHLSELGQKRYAQIFVSIAAKAVAAGRQGCS